MIRSIKLGLSSLMFFWAMTGYATFLPPNDLYLENDINSRDANIDEAGFNTIIDKIEAVYGPLISSVHGAKLKVNRNWNSSTVNASASRSGNTWVLNMYGGLARRAETTPDGFALVVCHELGHHLGGFPTKGVLIFKTWAASEGQSDYFATQSCAREIWGDDDNSVFETFVETDAKNFCDNSWSTRDDQYLCYRSAMAGLSLANLLGALGGKKDVSFTTPDTKEVKKTSTSHPAAQCRLDTYVAGALCTVGFDVNSIPANENEAQKTSCMRADGYTNSARPLCWFKPKK